ncbi:nitrate- and nitrite sensing domain-containing protein [Saccharomonospora sp. NPDC006951]
MSKKNPGSRTRRSSIKARVLAIAFVPSIVLLTGGAALAGYLVYDAVQARDFSTSVHDAAEPGARFFAAVREERRLTLEDLASGGDHRPELDEQRVQTDRAAAGISAELQGMVDKVPDNVRASIVSTTEQFGRLPSFREQVDAGGPSLQEAYDFYNRLIDQFATGLNGVAQEAPDAETAYLRVTAMPLFNSADGMSRGDALAAAGLIRGGLTEQEFRTYVGQIGAYHAQLEAAVPEMIPSVREQYEQLIGSDAWQRLTTVENAFLRGNQTDLPVSDAEWRSAAREVGGALMAIYIQQSSNATQVALDDADRTLLTSIIAGAAVLIVSAGVFVVAWRLSNRLVRRLSLLRQETLDIADKKMPEIVERVREGERVDLDTEVSLLDHGNDEIGEVADAFNTAQQTAIAAAVEEAKTREGTKRVFLNIAHRSQVIVHRQLQALDAAERKQEDPDQLDMLFRLDHLSTRARRNAENLIILGGEQPGRQWRNPVAVDDLVRAATAETEDYTRVRVGAFPSTAVAGPVVGDLVHLLAELIDNATSFSPPQSRVEVRGAIVGRGVVIEVEDQGIGMEPEQADDLNEMLRNPPDFSFMALSEEPRLGLFVVARLAAKHGIMVTLRESAYGGIRAIVLVLNDLLSALPEPDDAPPAREPAPAPAPVPPAPRTSPAPQQAQTGQQALPVRRRPRQLDRLEGPGNNGTTAAHNGTGPQNGSAPPSQPRRQPAPQAPAPQTARQDQFEPMSQGRPALPRRRRQQNLAPQLMESGEQEPQQAEEAVATPEQARSRLSAFQRGTRQARQQDSVADELSGD